MREYHEFCPQCGCLDLEETRVALDDKGGHVSCPSCKWSGPVTEAIGQIVDSKLWTIERWADVMLKVITTHATAPLIQLFQFQGLIPRLEEAKTEEDKAFALEARTKIMQSVFAAAVEAAFTTALQVRKEMEARKSNDN